MNNDLKVNVEAAITPLEAIWEGIEKKVFLLVHKHVSSYPNGSMSIYFKTSRLVKNKTNVACSSLSRHINDYNLENRP